MHENTTKDPTYSPYKDEFLTIKLHDKKKKHVHIIEKKNV